MDIWLIILISFTSAAYLLGGIVYIINISYGEDFLCEVYKNVTTKVGFTIFLMLDIVMLPWTLVCCLIGGIILLFEKIRFRKED